MGIAVIVFTELQAVFYGYINSKDEADSETLSIQGSRMIIEAGDDGGFWELAFSGPKPSSRISSPVDGRFKKVSCVLFVTPDAQAKWEELNK